MVLDWKVSAMSDIIRNDDRIFQHHFLLLRQAKHASLIFHSVFQHVTFSKLSPLQHFEKTLSSFKDMGTLAPKKAVCHFLFPCLFRSFLEAKI